MNLHEYDVWILRGLSVKININFNTKLIMEKSIPSPITNLKYPHRRYKCIFSKYNITNLITPGWYERTATRIKSISIPKIML